MKLIKDVLSPLNFKFYLFCLCFILLVTVISIFLYFDFKGKNFLSYLNLVDQSKANISLDGKKVIFNFKIADADWQKVQSLSTNLGINSEWVKGLSIELDENSISYIDQSLPSEVFLNFSDKKIELSSSIFPSLSSALPSKRYEIATQSSSLSLLISSETDYELNLKEPATLLKYATISGQVSLSEKLDPLFPIISKIDTIKVDVKGKNIKGEITLN